MPIKPGERRKTRTRQDIINTAYDLIIQHGLEAVSLRAVADHMDYSPAALYRYFSSKDELVDAVRAKCFENLNAAIFQRLHGVSSPARMLLIGGMTYIHFAREHPVEYHLMFHLGPSPSTQAENQKLAMRSLLYIIRHGIELGIFATDVNYTEDAIVLHCWSTVHGLAMLQTTVMGEEQERLLLVTETILGRVIASFTRIPA